MSEVGLLKQVWWCASVVLLTKWAEMGRLFWAHELKTILGNILKTTKNLFYFEILSTSFFLWIYLGILLLNFLRGEVGLKSFIAALNLGHVIQFGFLAETLFQRLLGVLAQLWLKWSFCASPNFLFIVPLGILRLGKMINRAKLAISGFWLRKLYSWSYFLTNICYPSQGRIILLHFINSGLGQIYLF